LQDARDILVQWAGLVSEGMLPNRFPDQGDQPEFNSVDASLWYVIAVGDYLRAAEDKPELSGDCHTTKLRIAIEAILTGYYDGTRFGIRADSDGLLAAGEHGYQLTWMDARVNGREITPRIGKPVEIQALWLNALAIGAIFSPRWRPVLEPLRDAAARAGTSIDAALLGEHINQAAYEQVFDAMERDRVDGLILSDSGEHVMYRQQIAYLAARYRLPAIYPYRDFVDVGGLLSYGIDPVDFWRRLAVVTHQVLGGAKPGDIPFYQLTKFDLVLNRTTARSLGLDFPPTLLAAADEVIE